MNMNTQKPSLCLHGRRGRKIIEIIKNTPPSNHETMAKEIAIAKKEMLAARKQRYGR